jgi:O-methyltransferase
MPPPFLLRYVVHLFQGAWRVLAGGVRLLRERPAEVRAGRYEVTVPLSFYSPWGADEAFRSVHEAVRNHTLVDLWRCYELWELVRQTAALEGSLIEVGVWRGGTGAIIAAGARSAGVDAPVFLCDTFQGVVKAGGADPFYEGGEHGDTSEASVRALLDSLGLDRAQTVAGIFPDESAGRIGDRRVRFCHVDVDVYDSARDVLEWVWPRLCTGGIVVFDDYGFTQTPGITRFVDEQRGRADRLVFHNLNGHGILVKRG